MDITTCPECAGVAEVQWRTVLESTHGPVEHAQVRCVSRHVYFLPVASLSRPGTSPHPHRPATSAPAVR
jgi:hypothetical protein